MSWLLVSQILTLCSTLVIVMALYLQAHKLWKEKSVDDFHPVLVIGVLVNEVIWLNYGIALWEWPIITIPILSIPAAIAIVVGYFKFRNPARLKEAKYDRKTQ